jgi:hypothetical protein
MYFKNYKVFDFPAHMLRLLCAHWAYESGTDAHDEQTRQELMCTLSIRISSIHSMRISFPIFQMPIWYTHKTSGFKRQVAKRLVSKHQVYKTSGLQNVRFQNVWFQNVRF